MSMQECENHHAAFEPKPDPTREQMIAWLENQRGLNWPSTHQAIIDALVALLTDYDALKASFYDRVRVIEMQLEDKASLTQKLAEAELRNRAQQETMVALLDDSNQLRSRLRVMEGVLRELCRAFVINIEVARERIISLGGQCDSVEVMERGDPYLNKARAALSPTSQSREGGGEL